MSFISVFLLLLFCEQLWAAFGNQQANKNGEAVGKSIKYRVVSDWKGLLLLYIQKCELLVLNID